MRIVVLSDTHAKDLTDLPERILEDLKRADLIIHAGDYTSKSLLDQMMELGNFKGVHGNMDTNEIKVKLPDEDIFEFAGFRIGVTHPSEGGSPFGLIERVKSKLGDDLDLIIYGHSHKPGNKIKGNTIFFNPGSATGAFPARSKTYGIIRIGDKIEAEIVKV
jgi:putative phosphoesterase